MTIRYGVTMDDVIAFNLYHFDSSPAMRRSRTVSICAGLVVFLLSALVCGFLASDEPALAIFITLAHVVLAVVWAVVMPIFVRRAQIRIVRNLYREGANKGVLGPHEMELTATHWVVNTPYCEMKSRFEIVEKVAIVDSHTFVYTSAVTAKIIPRAALGEREYEDFVEALEERVAKANGR